MKTFLEYEEMINENIKKLVPILQKLESDENKEEFEYLLLGDTICLDKAYISTDEAKLIFETSIYNITLDDNKTYVGLFNIITREFEEIEGFPSDKLYSEITSIFKLKTDGYIRLSIPSKD